MIVEDQLDRRVRRIGGIDKPEEFDELAAAVAILDEGVDLAGEQINPGQQAERAMAFVRGSPNATERTGQNASPGEIKSERWATSSRNPRATSYRHTRATSSSESAPGQRGDEKVRVEDLRVLFVHACEGLAPSSPELAFFRYEAVAVMAVCIGIIQEIEDGDDPRSVLKGARPAT
jgi:hypothetical protein